MPTPRRLPLMTMGWQTWSIVAVVVALVLAAVVFLMFG
jgi:hypothetical protein